MSRSSAVSGPRASPNRDAAVYTRIARWLHWGLAVLIFGMLGLGFYMQGLPLSPHKLKLYSWHKWAGVSIFLLVIFRLGWRALHPPPALPGHLSAYARRLVGLGHGLLYALMLAIPLSGWLMSSAKGVQTVWFGILPLPDLIPRNQSVGDALQTLHVSLNLFLLLMVTGHVAMALKHHFVDKDGTLSRMLPVSRLEKRS